MKNLIIDIEKHFPSSERIFHPADYFSPNIPLEQLVPLQPLPDSDYCRNTYNIDPILRLEDLEKEYNIIVIVWPIHSFNDFECTTNVEERRVFFKKIYDKINKIAFNKIVYFDGSDRSIIKCGLDWMKENDFRCDVTFKREFRRQFEYDYVGYNIHPFPFAVFGKPNPSMILYEKKITNESERLNECFWAGTPIVSHAYFDMICDRASILSRIYPYLVTKNGLNHDDFLREISNHKFFLNLNGTGHLCKRFFEGLSTGSLMMMQKTDLVFPFENDDYFSDETIFSTPEEFISKLDLLKKNEILYRKCLKNQTDIINKYFNYDWIKNYINSKI